MKKATLFLVILIAIFINSCEDVVNVNLNTAPPKLVIEASINWFKGTAGNIQKIKLTTTTDYYSNIIPIVSGATVFIENSSNVIFNFVEKPNSGEYACSNFIPKIDETYILTIISNGQTYTATESLKAVAPITKIIQNNEGGFDGKTIEIKTYFNDPSDEGNFYLFKYRYSNQIKSNYYVDEDKFYQGNEFFSISQNNDLKASDTIQVSHYGISKSYYNYMNVIVSIAGNSNGSPFQSPPATVRGNIINTTNFDNYALGYFSLSEVDTQNYIVQ
ncbi:MAG: DUF4249 domain-containing protein [Flavobacterium sp.]|uniref:DUF4249 domain-containing protein n=1 Tax=Flavobacterium sp. TaxID=239 RepID=UPI002636F8BF|nr:DUF4249 domain-containing protein [Flavobacterium sp.]MDD5149620.1 DUF4249 domain-containing protein [Flavobacterium sp.]